eukprot:12916262-Prorocentrum_lima.AAC.1
MTPLKIAQEDLLQGRIFSSSGLSSPPSMPQAYQKPHTEIFYHTAGTATAKAVASETKSTSPLASKGEAGSSKSPSSP